MSVKIKQKGISLNQIVHQVQKLRNYTVQAGHFPEQGVHKSGYRYDELMAFHHNGGNPDGDSPVVPRPVLDIVWANNLKLDDPRFKKAFVMWCQRPPSKQSDTKLLDDIGKVLATLIKDTLGNPAKLPVTNNPTPLVDTGELRANVAHRDTLSKKVRTM